MRTRRRAWCSLPLDLSSSLLKYERLDSKSRRFGMYFTMSAILIPMFALFRPWSNELIAFLFLRQKSENRVSLWGSSQSTFLNSLLFILAASSSFYAIGRIRISDLCSSPPASYFSLSLLNIYSRSGRWASKMQTILSVRSFVSSFRLALRRIVRTSLTRPVCSSIRISP